MTFQINPNAVAKACLLGLLFLPVITAAFWPFGSKEKEEQPGLKAARNKLKATGSFVQESVSSAVTYVGDTASQVQQQAKERGNEMAEAVTSSFKPTEDAEQVKEAGLKAMDEALASAKDAAASVVQKPKEANEDSVEMEYTKPQVVVKKVEDTEENTSNVVVEKMNEAKNVVTEKTMEAVDGLKEMASNAGEAVKDALTSNDSSDSIQDKAKEQLQATKEDAQAKAEEAQRLADEMKDMAGETMRNKADNVKEAAQAKAEEAQRVANDMAESAQKIASNTENAMQDAAVETANTMQTKTAEATNFAQDKIEDIKDKLNGKKEMENAMLKPTLSDRLFSNAEDSVRFE